MKCSKDELRKAFVTLQGKDEFVMWLAEHEVAVDDCMVYCADLIAGCFEEDDCEEVET